MTARDFLFVGCQSGHDWQSLGGANAGCAFDCACSVPVNVCTRCGDSDYGDNAEAAYIKAKCAEDWCKCGRPATDHEEPCCNNSGRCEAADGEHGITNCIHCGKELRERDGQWWTWDATDHPDPQPQGYSTIQQIEDASK
jgi:hypothetical protein